MICYSKNMILSERNIKKACLLLGIILITQGLFSQENIEDIQLMPNSLRRPVRGEAPRYPNDLVIGEMGQGDISESAYLFARNLLSALLTGRREAPVLREAGFSSIGSLLEDIGGIRARSYRLGGGKTEIDGSVSFLVRFIGPEESISGELFIRTAGAPEREQWYMDDLILEPKRALADIRASYRYNFSPYERFY